MRKKEVEVEGEKYRIREYTLAEWGEITKLNDEARSGRGSIVDAMVYILATCVEEPKIDRDKALSLPQRVADKLVTEILMLSSASDFRAAPSETT